MGKKLPVVIIYTPVVSTRLELKKKAVILTRKVWNISNPMALNGYAAHRLVIPLLIISDGKKATRKNITD